jgi:hypothetical protein
MLETALLKAEICLLKIYHLGYLKIDNFMLILKSKLVLVTKSPPPQKK